MMEWWKTLDRGQRDGVLWFMAVFIPLLGLGVGAVVLRVVQAWTGCG